MAPLEIRPMTNKRKQRARALSEKTGMSYQAAINAITTTNAPAAPQVERSLQQLLAELRATSTFGVVTRRCPAVSRSASLDLAIAQAEALARRPLYYAESTPVSLIVSATESRRLLDAGAAEKGSVQVIRAFTIGDAHTVSDQCENCRAWIWCFRRSGESTAEGTCDCGHRYRIVFDGQPDWDRALDLRCMRCGTEHRMSQRHENLNPWRHVNERQVLCNRCATGDQKAELGELKLRTRMLAGTMAPGQSIDMRGAAHNTEVSRFHVELGDWEQAVDRGEIVPADVQRRLREEAARLEEQRRRLVGTV